MAGPRAAEEVVVESLRAPRARDADVAAAVGTARTGFGRNWVVAALVVLIAVLLAVVFVLPQRVQRTAPVPDAAEPVADLVPDDVSPAEPTAGDPVYVDPAVRQRLDSDDGVPTRTLEGDDEITFSENMADYSGLDAEGRARLQAENTLGELLSAFQVFEGRGVERWAPVEYRRARELYTDGDKAYLDKQFDAANELYLGALSVLEPLYARIEPEFDKALSGAEAALEAGDRLEALRLYEIAVAITPSHGTAQEGLRRAQNLETVQRLVEQGLDYEDELDYAAAEQSFLRALELDDEHQPASDGVERVRIARTKQQFDTRMSEGFDALMREDYLGARAAFRVAQQLLPDSPEPADGLLQVDQGLRLQQIATLEREAASLEADEHWDAVIATYEEILKVDNTLAFANDGLRHAREMSALHKQLDEYIAEPDKLSRPSTMQAATQFVVQITTRPDIGPRLAAQRDELSRLLRRAATPLTVPLVSDNVTEVALYRVGRLGSFMRKEVELRPGVYVAVGSRPGYRDVRLEFRVAPEVDIEPVIIRCEEPI